MTKETLERILWIAKDYHRGMNDFGICSPADLVMSRMPEVCNGTIVSDGVAAEEVIDNAISWLEDNIDISKEKLNEFKKYLEGVTK